MSQLTEAPLAQLEATQAPREFRELFRLGRHFNLLLALENDDNARTVIRCAKALTERGAVPSVITASDLLSPVAGTPDSMMFYAAGVLGEDFHSQREQTLQALITEVIGYNAGWPIASITGEPVQSIVDQAIARQCELIVLGIHQHGSFEQAIGENTATRVMGRSRVPVLGVRQSLTTLPRKIMVATDFGDASRSAAHIAANLAEPGGTVVLVHVALPSAIVEEGDEGAALVMREGIEHAFLHLADEISLGKSIRVETVTRNGDVPAELIAAASGISPDLVAIASQRHNLLTRVLLGSVARKLTREGTWSMLVTPPAETFPARTVEKAAQ